MIWRSLAKPYVELEDDDVFPCERCDGTGLEERIIGTIHCRSGGPYEPNIVERTCDDCQGTGYLHGYTGRSFRPMAAERVD